MNKYYREPRRVGSPEMTAHVDLGATHLKKLKLSPDPKEVDHSRQLWIHRGKDA